MKSPSVLWLKGTVAKVHTEICNNILREQLSQIIDVELQAPVPV